MRFRDKNTLSAHKPASLWQKILDTIVILVQCFCKNVVISKQFKTTVTVLAFFDQQKGSVTRNKNLSNLNLLTKSKINHPGYKFSSIFIKNRQSNLVLVLVLILNFNVQFKEITLQKNYDKASINSQKQSFLKLA